MLNEMNASYRQVFLDGRPLPVDPTPSWQGYSSAKWEGDTLVVNSNGFRDDLWIDWNGSVITTAAKVQERIRRPDYGHLEVVVTVDDPTAYTKPWTVTLQPADRPQHRARGRDLPGKREVAAAHEVEEPDQTHSLTKCCKLISPSTTKTRYG